MTSFYFLSEQIASVLFLHRAYVILKRIAIDNSFIYGYFYHFTKGHHINPYCVVSKTFINSKVKVKIIDKVFCKFFERNITSAVFVLYKLTQMSVYIFVFVERTITSNTFFYHQGKACPARV